MRYKKGHNVIPACAGMTKTKLRCESSVSPHYDGISLLSGISDSTSMRSVSKLSTTP